MRPLLPTLIPSLLLAACSSVPGAPGVDTSGHNLADQFPDQLDHYWRYASDTDDDVLYMIHLGERSPAGEAWNTYRLWFGDDYDIVNGNVGYDVDLFFDHPDDWWFMGWQANPNGPSMDLGSELFAGNGVRFAARSAVEGQQWISEDAGGYRWTTTAVSRDSGLDINDTVYDDVWTLRLASDAGNVPFEGDWQLVSGTFPTLSLHHFGGTTWELVHHGDTEELLWDWQ